MPIRLQLQTDMIAAMKAKATNRLAALRYLMSQIKNREIDAKHELTDDEAIKLLQSEAKRRQEAIKAYQRGRREDLVAKETFELSVIESYLPAQLSDNELVKIIAQVRAANPSADFGTLMRETLKQVAGRAEGGRVAAMLHENKQNSGSAY